jgi:hypothetical protein
MTIAVAEYLSRRDAITLEAPGSATSAPASWTGPRAAGVVRVGVALKVPTLAISLLVLASLTR